MAESYFNDEQRSYMEYIFNVPREQRCDCGWFLLGQCSYQQCKRIHAASRAPSTGGDDE